ncbi:MAG: M48 family metallopeptidase [Patescibacteria group bacterium]
MYNQIDSNKRRTWLLIIIFTAVILFIGWFIGYYFNYGYGTLVIAAVFSVVMSLFSYYGGDQVALWSAKAQEIKEEDNTYVYHLVENLCITAGIPLPKIYLMPEQAINAFATGRDPAHASIALTVGAVNKLSKLELEGVIAHELSHIKNYDIRLMTIVIVLVGIISLLANWFLRGSLFGRGRSDNDRGNPALLIIGIILILLSPLVAQLIKLAISRRREYLADASGALLTRYPEGLAGALEKIANDQSVMSSASSATAHLYIANPLKNSRRLFANAFSTHPPVEDRISKLKEMTV